MNRLQKSAWFELAVVAVAALVGPLLFYLMARSNAKGIDYVLISVVVGSITFLAVFLVSRKKGFEAGFDEREKTIYKRALVWAVHGLGGALGVACIIPFWVLGGRNVIRVYYLPVIFFGVLFVGQFIHSAAVLIQCALEEEDG
jgi:cell division protein FtsW (lipid II flippase)